MRMLMRQRPQTVPAAPVPAVAVSDGGARAPARGGRGPGTMASLLERWRTWVEHVYPEERLRLPRPVWAISMDEDEVRAVLVQGREVLAWGVATLDEEGIGQQDADGAQEERARRLRTLLRAVGARRGRFLTDLPPYAPLMRRLDLPKIRRRYWAQVVQTELQDALPFALDDLDLAWQLRRTATGHQAFAIATPREVIDGRVRILQRAGLHPSAAYARATALAMMVGVADAIVVYLGQSHAAIALVEQGFPFVIHRIALAAEGEGPVRQALAVSRAIEQVAGYYEPLAADRDHPDRAPLPVALSGPLAAQGRLVEALRPMLHRPLLSFSSPFRSPGQFSATEYAASLGLVLADAARGRVASEIRRDQPLVANLLPDRHVRRLVPARSLAVGVTLLLLGTAALNVTALVDSKAADAGVLSSHLARLEETARQLRIADMRSASEGRRLESSEQMASALELHLSGLATEMDAVVSRLDTMAGGDSTVQLAGVSVQEGSYALSGLSSSYEDVTRYAAMLRRSGLFTEVKISRMDSSAAASATSGEPSSGTAVAFQIKVTVPPASHIASGDGISVRR